MSADGPIVRAIVVTTGRVGFLSETLSALAAQDQRIDAWHLVVVGGSRSDGRELGIPPGLGIPVTTVEASTFGEAVDALLREHPGQDEWLWLLHDDSAPHKTCLSRLLAVTRRRRTAGVVGPAQVRWEDPTRLVSVGITVSRNGRRLNVVDEDDIDQGQHEGREDVLAVGLAGALVRRDVWARLGGTDPAYGVFGDSTDFCRRVWRSGHDVVVAPRARVRHAQATLLGRVDDARRSEGRRSHSRVRASEWYHALAWARPWAIPLLLLWAGLSSLGRALVRVAAGEPRLAIADLAVPPTLATRMRSLRRSRAAIRRAGTTPVERRLLAKLIDVIGYIRTREFGLYEAWRAENRPNDVQRKELARLRVRRRWTFAVVALLLLALSVALYGTWIAPLVRGDMLAGSALGVTDVSTGDLWKRSWTGWSDTGLGGGAVDGSFAALMIPFSLCGGLAMGVGFLLVLSPLLAGVAGWLAAGAATRSLSARAIAAIAWGTWPTLTSSVADGRVGSVLAHILLPLLALALARASSLFRRDVLGQGEEFPRGRIGSPAAGAAAAVLLVAVTVAAPILLAPLLLAIVALVIVGKGHRRRLAFLAIPALVVQGPVLWQTWIHRGETRWWSLLVREPGPALSSEPVSGWDLLWGIGESPPAWPAATETGNLILTYLVGVVLVAAAALALASGHSLMATRLGWCVASGGLATAIIAQRTIAVEAAPDGSAAANGWPGPGLSLLALGLMMAVIAASGTPRRPPGAASGRTTLTIVMAGVLTIQVAATAWPGRDFGGDVHLTPTSVLPLVADLERSSQPATRVLLLRSLDDGTVSYTVLASDGDSSLLGRAHLAADGSWPTGGHDVGDVSFFGPTVATLAGSGGDAGTLLKDWGIGVVVVAPDSEALVGPLLLVPDLALIGASDLGVSWEVLPGSASGGMPKVSRTWLEEPDGDRLPLPSEPTGVKTPISSGHPDRVLILAVPFDSRWWATLNGHDLNPVEVDGRQGFEVGGVSGSLRVGYFDAAYRAWWILGLVAIAWALIGAIPLRDRAYGKRRR
ncbi:MAG: glycosyltransferase family 2 protein [Demequinaceae bacterium]|nr:glycosyltransferase family 2 protein [Demequinaceae bacterium]